MNRLEQGKRPTMASFYPPTHTHNTHNSASIYPADTQRRCFWQGTVGPAWDGALAKLAAPTGLQHTSSAADTIPGWNVRHLNTPAADPPRPDSCLACGAGGPSERPITATDRGTNRRPGRPPHMAGIPSTWPARTTSGVSQTKHPQMTAVIQQQAIATGSPECPVQRA